MDWGALLLMLVGIFATYKISRFARRFNSLKYLGYALAALFFTLGQGSVVLDGLLGSYGLTISSNTVSEWTSIIAISFLLSGLAVLIRESKPVFAQFPLIYAALPLLLVFSYWLVKDTLAIKEWLMSIFQGGALLVALLMYGVHSYRRNYFSYTLGAVALFLITFALYWFVPGIKNYYTWIWELLLGLSIALCTFGLEYSVEHLNPDKQTATTD